MLDLSKIKAITLDLDDTLWPIWPVIERAEAALSDWLTSRAPRAATVFINAEQRLAA
jgi:FMN hydrolase / 5-amino-6-(5-phospho-D-ribitylamino)uracil phosphatase